MSDLKTSNSKWPKAPLALSPEEEAIREDFVQYWLDVLPQRFGIMEHINHRLAISPRPAPGTRTLELGAGTGTHLGYEDLRNQEYIAQELRPELANELKKRYPQVEVLVGDMQDHIDLPDESVDRVVVVHALEHLPNLPAALKEIKRVLRPKGYFSAVIPCEGGLVYSLARNVSARRLFEQRYKRSYDWFIRSEHVNSAPEILEEVNRSFVVGRTSYWPLPIPSIQLSLVIGLTCFKH